MGLSRGLIQRKEARAMSQSKCGCVACDRFRYSGAELGGSAFPIVDEVGLLGTVSLGP